MGPCSDTPLALSPEPGGRTWRVVNTYTASTPAGCLTVPAGTVTDLASIPRPLWTVYPPHGRYTWAAVAHDWLYRAGRWADGTACTRSEADSVLYDLAIHHGARRSKAWLFWLAVRAAGGPAWTRYRATTE